MSKSNASSKNKTDPTGKSESEIETESKNLNTTKIPKEPVPKLNLLVYGIEQKSLTLPHESIKEKNYILHFEPLDTQKRFNDFNGVILFQGIFERFEEDRDSFGDLYYKDFCNNTELNKRKKEVNLLLEKGGFTCFILTDKFLDNYRGSNFSHTDLTKFFLNLLGSTFNRDNFDKPITVGVGPKRDEFKSFLDQFGVANSYFRFYGSDLNIKEIAKYDSDIVGMIVEDNQFFVPSRIPSQHEIKEYFITLAEAVVSTRKKLIIEVPAWIQTFKFHEEIDLRKKNEELAKQFGKNENRLQELEVFKRILMHDGKLLVKAVTETLRNGFELKVDDFDEFKEDIKILNEENEPTIFAEIKGTNRGVKRENINQADSHRERAELPPEFPTLLIINAHIKNSRKINEKNQEVPQEQIQHAAKINVLILRTLDLLELLRHFFSGKIVKDEILDIFQKKAGWLRVDPEKWEIVQ